MISNTAAGRRMDPAHALRRAFHICAPAFLGYYLLPDPLLGLPRFCWVLAVLAVVLVVEALRLATGRMFFGLRDYERRRVSAYAWAGIGLTLAFWLFPLPLVAAALFGLAWVDPLIGEMRRRKHMGYYPAIPLLAHFGISTTGLLALSDYPLAEMLLLAAAGSMTAVWAESRRYPVDDDFLMLVVPLCVMYVLHLCVLAL